MYYIIRRNLVDDLVDGSDYEVACRETFSERGRESYQRHIWHDEVCEWHVNIL